MNDLNTHINTTQQFTTPASMDTVPVVDRSAHVNFGVELAQRAAAARQQAPEPVMTMPPIMPIAN